MVNSYDRSIPSMFYDIDLCSTPGELDPIREIYYTAAIWNVIQKQTKTIRELPEVHKIKMIRPIGSGNAAQFEDDIMFKNQILLTVVEGRPQATKLKDTAPEVLALLHEALLDGIGWSGDQQEFLDKCLGMVEEWADLSLQCEPYIYEYRKFQERCQFAVNLALPSRKVEGDAGLMTLIINHHSGAAIRDMSGINLNDAELRTYAGRRPFTCWLDFGLRREMIKIAQPPPQLPTQEFTQQPENVMASTPAIPAATRLTSARPTQPGTTTASKVQQKLTVAETTTVNLVPCPAWVTQLGADLSIPLSASTAESTSVFNINVVPKSPARPIPSTSSSEAGSPTRNLCSSTRAVTPSPTKSAALASSSTSQIADRQGPATRSRSPVKSSDVSLPAVPEHEP